MNNQSEYDDYEDIEQKYPLAFFDCEGCKFLAQAWRGMAFDKKTDAHSMLLAAREAVKLIDCADFSELGRWGFFMSHPRRIAAATIAKTHRLTGVPLDAEREMLIDWFEGILLMTMMESSVVSWAHVCTHLLRAQEDPVVRANPLAVVFLEEAWIEAEDAFGAFDESALFRRIKSEAAEAAKSESASKGGQARSANFEKARAWVQEEWKNRTDTAQSKASFGRQYAPLVKRKFKKITSITDGTISRDWLKGL